MSWTAFNTNIYSWRVYMGKTVHLQMAKKLTVNRQKRNLYSVVTFDCRM